jgi:glycerophosphoryl diester phosphodiesterase
VTLLYAHRGAAAEQPENTIPSFERALEVGADALEFDVHATRDGVLVVSHDPDGARMAGVGRKFRDATWDDVRGWDAGHGFVVSRERPFVGKGIRIPTFEQMLEHFPGVRFNVDLKAPCADAAVELLRRHKAEERVCLASFQAATLRRVRALGYAGMTSLARNEVIQLLALPAMMQVGPLAPRGKAAQLPTSFLRPFVVARCRALGLHLDYWTINDEATCRRALELRVDGIMTDDPKKLAPIVKAA